MEILLEFGDNFIDMFMEMSIYIMIGLLCVGILHTFVKKDSILKHLGKDKFSSVVKASAAGVPLPLCSCGVVPTAIELKKGGASNGAVISFLTSTPQTGVDSIFATYSLMGGVMAIFRPITAFCSGIISGAVVNIFAKNDDGYTSDVSSCCSSSSKSCCGSTKEQEPEEIQEVIATSSCSCGCSASDTTITVKENKLISVLKYAFGDFLDEISTHFVFGMLVATAISTFLPADFFVSLGLNKGPVAMLAMVLIGLPMYVCSASSIPIAMSLMTKGLSLGGGFVFLFTGPVTNMASLIVLIKALGKKVTGIYVACVIACSMLFGALLDFISSPLALSFTEAGHHHHSSHGEESIFTIISAVIFAILVLKGLFVNAKKKFNKPSNA